MSMPVMISSVTLAHLRPEDIDGNYWRKNMDSPVLFHGAMTKLLGLKFGPDERHVDLVIEIGVGRSPRADLTSN